MQAPVKESAENILKGYSGLVGNLYSKSSVNFKLNEPSGTNTYDLRESAAANKSKKAKSPEGMRDSMKKDTLSDEGAPTQSQLFGESVKNGFMASHALYSVGNQLTEEDVPEILKTEVSHHSKSALKKRVLSKKKHLKK